MQVYAIMTIIFSVAAGMGIGRFIIFRSQRKRMHYNYTKHIDRLREMDEDHERALIMVPFVDYLTPYLEEFEINDMPDEKRVVFIKIEKFKKVYELMNPAYREGLMYYLGMKINWIAG